VISRTVIVKFEGRVRRLTGCELLEQRLQLDVAADLKMYLEVERLIQARQRHQDRWGLLAKHIPLA